MLNYHFTRSRFIGRVNFTLGHWSLWLITTYLLKFVFVHKVQWTMQDFDKLCKVVQWCSCSNFRFFRCRINLTWTKVEFRCHVTIHSCVTEIWYMVFSKQCVLFVIKWNENSIKEIQIGDSLKQLVLQTLFFHISHSNCFLNKPIKTFSKKQF